MEEIRINNDKASLAYVYSEVKTPLRKQRDEMTANKLQVAIQLNQMVRNTTLLTDMTIQDKEMALQEKETNLARTSAKQKIALLEEQMKMVEAQAESVYLANQELTYVNNQLQEKVNYQAYLLRIQNEKLAEYCHVNSHQLRAPVATITGLVNLMRMVGDESQRPELLDMLDESVMNLNKIVREIQQIVAEG